MKLKLRSVATRWVFPTVKPFVVKSELEFGCKVARLLTL